jgi:hypothetical protein
MNSADFYQFNGNQREMAAGVLKQAKNDLRRFHNGTSQVERELYLDARDQGSNRGSVKKVSNEGSVTLKNRSLRT